MFYDNFVKLCALANKSPSVVAVELGISKSTVSSWKHRKNGPSDITMQKIANFFGVSVSQLTETEIDKVTKSDPPTSNNEEAALDKELISCLVQLTPEEQAKVGAFVYGLLAARGAGTFRQASGD